MDYRPQDRMRLRLRKKEKGRRKKVGGAYIKSKQLCPDELLVF